MRPLILLLLVFCSTSVIGDDTPVSNSASPTISKKTLKTAIRKAIPVLEQGSQTSSEERTCFTCHNQALPVMALTAAGQLGFKVDQENLEHQAMHTWEHLNRGKDRYNEGRGQGGQVMTAGYAMWTLAVSGHEADDVTSAVAHYLLEYQTKDSRWPSTSKQRPPSAGSDFTATYLALYALSEYGTDQQAERIKQSIETAAQWIQNTVPTDTEDSVFQFRSLDMIGAEKQFKQACINKLLAAQHDDGGWAQSSEMQPDAYATATVLVALQEFATLPENYPAIQSGLKYLLKNQLDDGTWHVVTHADPIQDYYESGFPHGEDQFISITATSWAVLALTNALSELTGDEFIDDKDSD